MDVLTAHPATLIAIVSREESGHRLTDSMRSHGLHFVPPWNDGIGELCLEQPDRNSPLYISTVVALSLTSQCSA
ncbi:MAG: hypothetical protein VCB26_03750, partial [Candidatus Hydrogenedentota bacterium]